MHLYFNGNKLNKLSQIIFKQVKKKIETYEDVLKREVNYIFCF